MNLKEHYKINVIPAMREKFGYKNILAVPRIVKLAINVGLPAGLKDERMIEARKETLMLIAGQRAVERKAKKSISGFKIRQGQVVGLMLTLRGARMYDFLERLIWLTFPRIRDFRGLQSSIVDGHGNATIGFREVSAFPETKAGDVQRQHGLEVTVVTTAKTQKEGLELLKLMGFPFKTQ